MLKILQKRVELLFVADSGGFAVPWNHHRIVRQGKQPRLDGTQNLAAVATRQIGTAYAFAKKRVTGNQFLFLWNPDRQASLRVTRRGDDVEIGAA